MSNPVVCPKEPLTRDLDVSISLSRAQTEIATDLTLMCFASPGLEFDPDNERVQFFSSSAAALAAVPANSEASYAIQAFFARDDRPSRIAIGRVFESPVAGKIVSGKISADDLVALKAISDGSFTISVDGSETKVTDVDFSGIDSLGTLATLLASKITGTSVFEDDTSGTVEIVSSTTGERSSVSYMTSAGEGTDVSALLHLTKDTALKKFDGYTPEGLVSELQLIQKAANCAGSPIYGWAIDSKYRETPEQFAVAQWAESQKYAIFGAVTNDPKAYTTSDSTSIVYTAKDSNLTNTFTFYHDNPQVYPEVSYLAKLLSVNYALDDSALTMKFKDMPGIPTVPLSETQLTALTERRCNTYVSIGNTAQTIREGVQAAEGWFSDSRVNLDNFVEELQVAIFNVFLRKPKVPYTQAGQDMLISAAQEIATRYTDNGVFADRTVSSTESQAGYVTLPAVQIEATPVYKATASERASRLAPPLALVAYEAGAMHKVNVNITVEA